MKKPALLLATLVTIATNIHSRNNFGIETQNNPVISFTENKGQVHDQNYVPRPDVLYGATTGNMAVHIKKTGVSYQLYRVDSYKNVTPTSLSNHTSSQLSNPESKNKEIDQQTIYRIDLKWLNANTNFIKTEDEALSGYNNYYLASCPDGALNVKSYKGIRLKHLYKGIDLHYYEKNGELKHDYIVSPHADYKQIQVKVEGAEISVNEDGSILLTTPLGKIQEGAPVVYQNGKRLKATWVINKNTLSFEIENYNSNYELIIDPVTRLWGTYYGGSGYDRSRGTSADLNGDIYLAGTSDLSTGTIIATSGAHQSSIAGSNDAFLTKFNSLGLRVWSTYYGGTSYDTGNNCAIDISGNVYLTGSTSSSSGISTSSGHQTSNNGGSSDAFLVKFNSSGIRQWATYYGSGGTDDGYSCSTDLLGNVFLSGYTGGGSGSSIATIGAHQTVFGGGNTDAFLVKFNGSGVRQWGTFYGGPTGYDGAGSCAIDGNGDVYIAGDAGPSTGTIIATSSSHQTSFGGGSYDGFLAKFNTNGVRQWGTYYGGSSTDHGWSCKVDLNGDIYFSGATISTNTTSIATPGSHQSNFAGGTGDAFLIKFTANGVRIWGTYYGGVGSDNATSVTSDALGNVYITGFTSSTSGTDIATTSSHQPNYGGGTYDAYMAKFNLNGVRQWGTYYGGTGEEWAYSCAADLFGSVYMAGFTNSNSGTAISSSGSHQSSYGGGTSDDAFLARFDVCDVAPTQPSTISGSSSLCSASGPNTYSVAVSAGATSYTWSLPVSWSGANNTNIISATPGSTGVFTVVAGNSCGTSAQQTLAVKVLSSPVVSATSGTICNGESFTLTPSGANTYTYSSGPVVTPVTTTSYSITGTGTNNCISSNTAVAVVNVNPLPTITASTTNSVLCVGEQATLTAGGASNYTFNPGGTGANITINPIISTNYTITGTNTNGCKNTALFTQTVDACTGISVVASGASATSRVFPNPTSGILNVELDSDYKVIIVNAIGEIVYSVELISGKHQINIEHLAKGIYMVKIGNAGDAKSIKLIKE